MVSSSSSRSSRCNGQINIVLRGDNDDDDAVEWVGGFTFIKAARRRLHRKTFD